MVIHLRVTVPIAALPTGKRCVPNGGGFLSLTPMADEIKTLAEQQLSQVLDATTGMRLDVIKIGSDRSVRISSVSTITPVKSVSHDAETQTDPLPEPSPQPEPVFEWYTSPYHCGQKHAGPCYGPSECAMQAALWSPLLSVSMSDSE